MPDSNRRFILLSRSEGRITDDTFELTEEAIPQINEGQALIRTQWISLDPTNRAWIGENIASGYTSARAVFNGWIESPRHRANIMRRQFRRVGFAKVGLFYVAEFSS